MRAREMKRLMAMTERLTPVQRNVLVATLTSNGQRCEALKVVESRVGREATCPKCQGHKVVRNGQADGLQRYKCRGCGVTFNALTGTPLARLRHREKWLLQAQALEQGLSVRNAAARMGVHRTTSFRWRHRFLTLPREVKETALTGVAEADETYVLRSFKGQCRAVIGAGRAARRRGGKARQRGLSHEQVPVLVVRNRAGQTTDSVLEVVDKASVSQVLRMAVAPDAVLCTDGSNFLAAVAKHLGLEHQAVDVQSGRRVRGAWHIQNVNAYHGRFKEWIRRFKGVATSYLPNYLGWFRALDRNAGIVAQPASLLALAVGALAVIR